jgi:hypothetical protein
MGSKLEVKNQNGKQRHIGLIIDLQEDIEVALWEAWG